MPPQDDFASKVIKSLQKNNQAVDLSSADEVVEEITVLPEPVAEPVAEPVVEPEPEAVSKITRTRDDGSKYAEIEYDDGSIETVELTIEEGTIVSDDETEEDLDFNSLEISMLKERMYDLEERVSDLEDTDDEEEEESDDDDSVI